MTQENRLYPLHVFRFQVDFEEDSLDRAETRPMVISSGAFAELTGLEATMEPKAIKEGGLNTGQHQRVGPVSHATAVLKRGMTTTRHLWQWFELVSGGAYAHRLNATVTLFDMAGQGALSWRLEGCLPVKIKAADLQAKGTEVGVEELHLAYEDLYLLESPAVEQLEAGGSS